MATKAPRRHLPNRTTETGVRRIDRYRGSSSERGYDEDWKAIRDIRRELDENLCQHCLREGGLAHAMESLVHSTKYHTVDHIVPIHVRPDWRLEVGNTQVLCDSHNAIKTHADNARYGSAEAKVLSPSQIAARAEAMRLTEPQRQMSLFLTDITTADISEHSQPR